MDARRRGAALLLVVAVIGLLAFLTAEFQRRSHLEAVIAANGLNALEAHGLVRSGYAAAVAMLRRDADDNTTDSRKDIWAGMDGAGTHLVPVGDYVISVKIEDARGKFPLGSLVDLQGKAVAAKIDSFERMLSELDLKDADPAALADALVDWIDADSTNDRFEYNEKFEVPNRPLAHLSELSRIEGFDRLSPEDMRKIVEHVDLRSEAAINVNTAPIPVLMALNVNFRYDDAKKLYEELTSTPDSNGSVVGRYLLLPPVFQLAYSSDRFRMRIDADANGVVRRAECLVRRNKAQKRIDLEEWVQY